MFETLFAQVEAALDAHPVLCRHNGVAARLGLSTLSEPSMLVDRHGFDVRISVKIRDTRKRPTVIGGCGETPEQAVAKLIASLDLWAKVLLAS